MPVEKKQKLISWPAMSPHHHHHLLLLLGVAEQSVVGSATGCKGRMMLQKNPGSSPPPPPKGFLGQRGARPLFASVGEEAPPGQVGTRELSLHREVL